MATSSRFNRPYAELPAAGENTTVMGGGGSIANRPPVPVGGGGMTPERRMKMFYNRAWRAGDEGTAMQINNQMFNAERWGRQPLGNVGGMGGGPAMRPFLPPAALPPMNGTSMTSRTGQPPPLALPLEPAMPIEPPSMMPGEPTMSANVPPPMPWNGQPLPGATMQRPLSPLPPSTLDGGSGVPAGPRFSVLPAGQMDAIVDNNTGKFVNSYMRPEAPQGIQMMPVPGSNLRLPTMGGKPVEGLPLFNEQPVPGSLVRRETQGKPVPTQLTPQEPPKAPPIQWEKDDLGRITGGVETVWNAEKGRYEYRRVSVMDANGDGIPDAQQAAPTSTAASEPGAVKTAPSGYTYKPVVATGQMPTAVNYQSPLSPQQSLKAASDHYAATGDDSALRKHFQDFPSQAAQFNEKEAKVWQQIAQNLDLQMATMDQVQAALASRQQHIAKYNFAGPAGAGFYAQEWATLHPKQAALLNQLPNNADNFRPLEEARRANAQFQAARMNAPIPADFADDPSRVGSVAVPVLPPRTDAFWDTVGKGASAMGKDVVKTWQDLSEFAKKHPIITLKR